MKNNVIDWVLELTLKELGCTVKHNEDTVTIQSDSTQLRLEKRSEYWFDLEKNLWFYSRAQILIYMAKGTLRG